MEPTLVKKITVNDPDFRSMDLPAENLVQLKALFPETFVEGKIDFAVLKQLLGGAIEEGEEKYGLCWHGKRRARQLALTPSLGTLRPCPEESVDWETTQNLMIEGDNLEILKLLQKSYAGKVKLIYIDPPYNTGNDFVYRDDYRDNIKNYLRLTGQVNGEGHSVSSNTEASGRFHTDWLNMMYPRLKLARNLLRNDGVICISIDDEEEASLRKVCDEIFGEENFIATIVWQKRYVSNVTAKWLSDMHGFIFIYARNREAVKVNTWKRTAEQLEAYRNPDNDPRGPWRAQDLSASKPYMAGLFPIIGPTGAQFRPPPNRYWRCNEAQFEVWRDDGRIWWGVNNDARPMLKSFLEESDRGVTPNTWWDYSFAGHNKEATLELKKLFNGDAPFDTPKPVKLMKRLIELFCEGEGVVMDFFAGSAPLGQAIMEFNSSMSRQLRFVLSQLPEKTNRHDYETIADIAKERLRRVSLAMKAENPGSSSDLGFRVFKLDASNLRVWDPKPGDLEHMMMDHVDHLVPGRTEQDLLFEVLLKRGVDLCSPIETREIEGKTVSTVGGVLFTCLAEAIDRGATERLALGIVKWRGELAPDGDSTVVFRDSAFPDDVAKANITEVLKQHGFVKIESL